MPKLQETKGMYFVTVPKHLVQAKKWVKGQVLAFAFNERGNVELPAV